MYKFCAAVIAIITTNVTRAKRVTDVDVKMTVTAELSRLMRVAEARSSVHYC